MISLGERPKGAWHPVNWLGPFLRGGGGGGWRAVFIKSPYENSVEKLLQNAFATATTATRRLGWRTLLRTITEQIVHNFGGSVRAGLLVACSGIAVAWPARLPLTRC